MNPQTTWSFKSRHLTLSNQFVNIIQKEEKELCNRLGYEAHWALRNFDAGPFYKLWVTILGPTRDVGASLLSQPKPLNLDQVLSISFAPFIILTRNKNVFLFYFFGTRRCFFYETHRREGF